MHYSDAETGGYYLSADDAADLVMRPGFDQRRCDAQSERGARKIWRGWRFWQVTARGASKADRLIENILSARRCTLKTALVSARLFSFSPAQDAWPAGRQARPRAACAYGRREKAASAPACAKFSEPRCQMTTISAPRSRKSKCIEQCHVAEQIVHRRRRECSRSAGRLSPPRVVTGQHREPHQILRSHRVVIGRGIIAGRMRPHDQSLGCVVGGEIIAAGFRIGVMRVEARPARSARDRDSGARRSPHKRECGADHRGEIGGQAGIQELALAPGMAEPVALASSVGDEIEGALAPSPIHSGSSRRTPALASAAIISPFQSASTLSSSPGRTRPSRASQQICRAASLAALHRRRCAVPRLSRLRILWPSKLPSAVTS